MLPSSAAVSLIQNHLRNQQGVIEVAKPISDGQLLVTVGERVQAMVTDQLPNGRFAVLVKDQLLDLNLPRNTQPGEKLELTVLSSGPKLSFALSATSTQPPAQSTQPQSNAEVALSHTGKMLGELLVRAEGQPKSANLQQTQPLFEGRPVPVQLAGQLATRLAESGLFYESHQAGWVNGERSLQALLREPQAQASNAATSNTHGVAGDLLRPAPGAMPAVGEKYTANTNTNTNEISGPRNMVDTTLPATQLLSNSVALKMQNAAGDILRTVPDVKQDVGQKPVTDNPGQRSLADLSLSAAQSQRPEQAVRHLVQQQLELLENHPLVWQGQAWPGQPLRWQLELENERNPDMAEGDASRVWQTRLDLDLPHLGAVGVVASLRDGQFSLRFEAQDSTTVETLKNKQAILAERFDAAGLALASTLVMRHDQENNA